MTRLEKDYQLRLIKRILDRFPGAMALKNDSGYIQGIPDWTILYGPYWATLEAKRKPPTKSDYEPNQEYYIELMNGMSFSACVYPENEEEVLHALEQTFTPGRQARNALRQQPRLGSVRSGEDRKTIPRSISSGKRNTVTRSRSDSYHRGRKAS